MVNERQLHKAHIHTMSFVEGLYDETSKLSIKRPMDREVLLQKPSEPRDPRYEGTVGRRKTIHTSETLLNLCQW